MLGHVGQGFFGDAVHCQPHLFRNRVAAGLLLSRKLFIQLYLQSQGRSKLLRKGLKGRDEPVAES